MFKSENVKSHKRRTKKGDVIVKEHKRRHTLRNIMVGAGVLGTGIVGAKLLLNTSRIIDISKNGVKTAINNNGIISLGKVGNNTFTFASNKKKSLANDMNLYIQGFTVNSSFARKKRKQTPKESIQLIATIQQTFKKHLDIMDDNSVIKIEPARDNLESKRRKLFSRVGFRELPNTKDKGMYALKKNGKFTRIEDKDLNYYQSLINQ
jgi:hypothetical protein